jgi:YegS/Rv2252/BmrU family lipid kinase
VHVIAGQLCTEKSGGRLWARAQALLQACLPSATVRVTDSPDAAIAMTRRSVAEGANLVVAAGGDGTISQVVNGLLTADQGVQCRLGILPLGRGNDYYRTLLACARQRIDFNLSDAVRRLSDAPTTIVDTGVVTYRGLDGLERQQRFMNLVTFGFSAAVAHSVPTMRWAGPAAYQVGLVTNLLTYRNVSGRVSIDGVDKHASVFNLNVALGRYYGTGMFAAPQASLTDGLLDVVVFDGMNVMDVIRYMPNNYNGHFRAVPKVKQWQGRHVEVDGPDPIPVQVDGEFVGTTPVSIDIEPSRLQLVF